MNLTIALLLSTIMSPQLGGQGGGVTIPKYKDHGINRNCFVQAPIQTPIPTCEDSIDADCLQACYTRFYHEVAVAAQDANDKCQTALAAYDREITDANSRYVQCINSLSTTNPFGDTRRTCALAHESAYMIAKVNYNNSKNNINQHYNNRIRSVQETFAIESAACCVVGDKQ